MKRYFYYTLNTSHITYLVHALLLSMILLCPQLTFGSITAYDEVVAMIKTTGDDPRNDTKPDFTKAKALVEELAASSNNTSDSF